MNSAVVSSFLGVFALFLFLEQNCAANSELAIYSRPIADTCSITGCSADLTYPPCGNYTRHGEKGERGDRGEKGPQGVQGEQGLQGAIGEKGEMGLRGSQGPHGETGDVGETGDQGENGDQGEPGRAWQGVPGEPGDIGRPGDRGPLGKQGCTGDIGEKGVLGPQGDVGPVGLNGARGTKGEQGPQGDEGLLGRPGARGPAGNIGEKGDKGDIGLPGDKGVPGPRGGLGPKGVRGPSPQPNITAITGPTGDDGDDAYCHKVASYYGDNGDQGDQGPRGPSGPKGNQGKPGKPGVCIRQAINYNDVIFPPEKYGDRGERGPPAIGVRGQKGDPGTCDGSECHCKKKCSTDETEAIFETCIDKFICNNDPPKKENLTYERGPIGPKGIKGDQGMPGDGVRGPKGERGPEGASWPTNKVCDCCPECMRFANTETYAVHSISPNAVPSCYDDDEQLYKGYSLMHYASYSPSPTVSQDLSDIGSCVQAVNREEFAAVPFQSCSSSEENCRFAERRPVVIWLSNSTNSDGSRMLNAADTADQLSKCVACRSRGGVFFVNHTLSKEAPTCPDSSELWAQRYGGLAAWTWKLRYTGFTWVMYQANDVQGGNMLQSPGSCYPGEFSSTLFYECQGPDRCYNKFGEFKNFWMMNADVANAFYANSSTPTGKYRRADVEVHKDSSILAKCAVCELVPPTCTKCKMPRSSDGESDLPTFSYVMHSQKNGGDDAAPMCSDEVDPSGESKALWTGYSLMQVDDLGSRGTTSTDLGESGSCVADFDSVNVVKDGESASTPKRSLWLAGVDLRGAESFSLANAPKEAVSRCSVCASRYPVAVVHSPPDDISNNPPACPDPNDIILWHGFSLLSVSRQQNRQQYSLSRSVGSCLREINDGACALECLSSENTCRPASNGTCNWTLRKQHPMMDSIVKTGKLPENDGERYTFDWTPFISKCTVCAIRSE